ncbi:transketolase [Microbacterium sp. bgisy207]|uniref:transketolase n=1 Tax=Microbacterium sp. bgisy207 TaxID=3413800 RepID=UPI003EBE4D2F
MVQQDSLELQAQAIQVRRSIVTMLQHAGSGHSAGPLGMADLLTALYFNLLVHDPADPEWEGRDLFLLSNGHTAPVLYAAMAHAGYFPVDELMTLRRLGSRLQGHPERLALPGLESTSGPLGSGLSQAAGAAYVLQHIDAVPDRFVYVMMGDGELNEGNIWEAAMFAGKYRLNRLIGIVDRNFIQIDGSTEDVMPLEDLAAKWESFGWHVLEIDGHDMQAILDAVADAKDATDKPTVIIARTIPGKGVSFMEHDYLWHGKVPDIDQARAATAELDLLANGASS